MSRISAVLIGLVLVGCSQSPPSSDADRQKMLRSMASDEVQFITDPRDRLTRQLNFAYDQIERKESDEAKASLAAAAKTLHDAQPGQLDAQLLLGGWVSISELSRSVDDKATARTACDQAVTALRKLEPATDRPPFVTGVAFEIRQLQGPTAAAELLKESVQWATPIKEVVTRRTAVALIADGIFHCDDYPGGLAALRTDADASWRTDTLKRFSEDSPPGNSRSLDWIYNVGNATVPGSIAANQGRSSRAQVQAESASTDMLIAPPPPYIKPVDFQSVFRSRN